MSPTAGNVGAVWVATVATDGVSDPWFSAWDTLDYWQRARERNGAEAWDDASRLYLVPGMGHCGGGANTFDRFDLLSPLVAWVEEGEAPKAVPSFRTRPTEASGHCTRTRPTPTIPTGTRQRPRASSAGRSR